MIVLIIPALFSDQGEVAEVNEDISYAEDEENTSNNVGIPRDLEPTVDIPYAADMGKIRLIWSLL